MRAAANIVATYPSTWIRSLNLGANRPLPGPVMSAQYLIDAAGNTVGSFETTPNHETILRAAYGLSDGDVLTGLLDGDTWQLGIIIIDDQPAGPVTRCLDFTAPASMPCEKVSPHLMELAVLDLWDKGWTIKRPHDDEDSERIYRPL